MTHTLGVCRYELEHEVEIAPALLKSRERWGLSEAEQVGRWLFNMYSLFTFIQPPGFEI